MQFLKRVVGYGTLFLIILQAVSLAPAAVRHAVAVFDLDTPLGQPPFRVARGGLTVPHKTALRRFPDLDSCLFSWGSRPQWDSLPRERILQAMAWTQIHSSAEVEVCMFRVLYAVGDYKAGEQWLQHQGFSTMLFENETSFGSSRTHTRVSSDWSIRTNGRKFDGYSLFGPLLPSLPYNMGVEPRWDSETGQLSDVSVRYSVL